MSGIAIECHHGVCDTIQAQLPIALTQAGHVIAGLGLLGLFVAFGYALLKGMQVLTVDTISRMPRAHVTIREQGKR